MAIINMSDLFPVRKSFTDIVSYATDEFGCVQSLPLIWRLMWNAAI